MVESHACRMIKRTSRYKLQRSSRKADPRLRGQVRHDTRKSTTLYVLQGVPRKSKCKQATSLA